MPIPSEEAMRPHRSVKQAWCVLACVVMVAPMGCRKPLFPKDEPRTQYDRYDRIRGEWVPATVTDQYGQPEENVRARLLRKQ